MDYTRSLGVSDKFMLFPNMFTVYLFPVLLRVALPGGKILLRRNCDVHLDNIVIRGGEEGGGGGGEGDEQENRVEGGTTAVLIIPFTLNFVANMN